MAKFCEKRHSADIELSPLYSESRNTNKPPATWRNKALLYAIVGSLTLAIIVVGSEVFLRLEGIKPWRTHDVAIKVSPGGKLFAKHPTLGYSHIAGKFTVTLADGYSLKVTHLPNTLRITHPLDTYGGANYKKEIWIFGCSYTYGFSLNDEETYPWLLQERFPEYEIVNFGVSGYGTIHSLIQFREALKAGPPPKIAVLAYASFHDLRNTFLRIQRKRVAPWNHLGSLMQPYARLDRDGKLEYHMADTVYSEFPLMKRLALAHFVEMEYDDYEDWRYRSHDVSKMLVKEIAQLAKEHGVEFIVAGISHLDERGGKWNLVTTGNRTTLEMLHFARENGIPSVDISVNERLGVYNNLPHNGHPNALANKEYADKLDAFLRAQILNKRGLEAVVTDHAEKAWLNRPPVYARAPE